MKVLLEEGEDRSWQILQSLSGYSLETETCGGE